MPPTVNVKVPTARVLPDFSVATPALLVVADALPVTSPLQAPVTVAPTTRLPLASSTVTVASASDWPLR